MVDQPSNVTTPEHEARDKLLAAIDLYDRRNRFRIEYEWLGADVEMVVTRRLTPGRRNPATGKCVREIGLLRRYKTFGAAQADLESMIVDFDRRSAVPLSWEQGGDEEATNYTVMLDLGKLPA